MPVLNALGSIQESLGDHTSAITYYQRALNINQKSLGPYSPAFAENLHSLARENSRVGNRKTAEKQYKQSISILMMEPSLSASDRLQNVMVEYTDLLKSDDDSNKSLIDDFKKDMLTQSAPGSTAHQSLAVVKNVVPDENKDLAPPQLRPLINRDAINNATGSNATSNNTTSNNTTSSNATSSNTTSINTASADVAGAVSEWQKEVATTHDVLRQSQVNSDPEISGRGMQLWNDTTLLPAYKVHERYHR